MFRNPVRRRPVVLLFVELVCKFCQGKLAFAHANGVHSLLLDDLRIEGRVNTAEKSHHIGLGLQLFGDGQIVAVSPGQGAECNGVRLELSHRLVQVRQI